MEALTQTGPRPRAGVAAWVLSLARPARSWRATRIDDLDDAERAIANLELRERVAGTRLRVELVRGDGTSVVASSRVFDGRLWVDVEPIAAAAEGARAS